MSGTHGRRVLGALLWLNWPLLIVTLVILSAWATRRLGVTLGLSRGFRDRGAQAIL